MMRIRWIAGMIVAAGILLVDATPALAADADTARTISRRPSAALLLRLARAQQLSSQPRTFSTQVGVAVAARRHGDAIERKKRTLDILNNQYLRGTAATTPSEAEIRQTIGTLEAQLEGDTPPENAYEVRYYLAACYESLGDVDRATELLQRIVDEHGDDEAPVVQSFVDQARADLERLGA